MPTNAQTEQEKMLEKDIDEIENFNKYEEEYKQQTRNTEKGRQADAITEPESE